MEARRARTLSGQSSMHTSDAGSSSVRGTNDPFAGFHSTVATVSIASPSTSATVSIASPSMASPSTSASVSMMASPSTSASAQQEAARTWNETRTYSRSYSYTRTFSCAHTHRSSMQPPPPPTHPSFVRIRWKRGRVGEEFPREIQDRLTRQQFTDRVAEINGIGRQHRRQQRHATRIAIVLAVVALLGAVAAACIGAKMGVSATLTPLFIMIALFAFASPYFAYRASRIKWGMIEAVKARLVTFTIEDDVRGIKWQLFTAVEGDKKKEKQRYIEIDIIESTELREPVVFEIAETNEPQNDLPPAYEADASPPTYAQLRAHAHISSPDMAALNIAEDMNLSL